MRPGRSPFSIILAVSFVFGSVLAASGQALRGENPAPPLLRGDAGRAVETPRFDVGWLALAVGNIDTAALPNLAIDRPAAFDADIRYVVQLDGPLSPEREVQLVGLGVNLGNYVPAYAFLCELSAVNPNDLADLPFVIWVGEWRDAWKVAPNLGEQVFESDLRRQIETEGNLVVDITFFADIRAADAIDSLAAIPGVQMFTIEVIGANETITAIVSRDQIAAVAALGGVQFIEEVGEITLRNDTNRWIVQSNQLNITPLYNGGLRGEGQIVGILDTRVTHTHCSFHDNQPFGPNHRKIQAYNTSTGNGSHGTHVAGTAVGDDGTQSANRGVAYLAKMCFNLIPSFNESSVYSSLSLHHSQGARVHSNSWGNDGTTAYDGLARGIDAFCYDFEDSMVCLAVTNLSTLKNPENAKNLLAVGATRDTPNQHQHCTGGTGPTSDLRRKPEIYAPGCDTISSRSSTSCNTRTMTGTSMACPAIAGTGLLVRQYFTDGYYPSGAPTPSDGFIPTAALIKATLLNSSVDMTGIAGYPSNQEGWGRVMADRSLHLSGQSRKIFVDDVRNADGLATNDMVEYQAVVLSSNEDLRITLVWTEPPASAGATFASINNLDLEVVSPTGSIYRGNVFSSGQSTTGGSFDIRNNVEQVHRFTPETGQWIIRVRGTGVNQARQGYALVITGDIEAGVEPRFELAGFVVEFGQIAEGGLDELQESNDEYLIIDSVFGFSATEPNLTEMNFRFDGNMIPTSPLTATIESRLNNSGGVAQVRFRNFSEGNVFDLIHTYPIGLDETIEVITDIDPAKYVNPSNHRARMRVRHVVVATFSATGFQSFYDHLTISAPE